MTEEQLGLPSLTGLRTFDVVARHLNFRLAAEELSVTQAAVAQQIRLLEAALGVKLFDRLPRGLAFTDSGSSYSVSIRKAFELMLDATRTLKPNTLHLTLSVPPTLAVKWLIPRIAQFTDANPAVDLRVLSTERLARFQSDGVDVVIRYGRPPFGPGLNAELLLEQHIVVVGSPSLVQRLGKPQDLEHMYRYLLLHDAHNFWPMYLSHEFGSPLQAAPKNLRFNNTSLAIEAAIAGQGVALVTRAFVQDDLKAGRLVPLFEHDLNTEAGFYILWPRKGRQPDALPVLRAWLMEQAALYRR